MRPNFHKNKNAENMNFKFKLISSSLKNRMEIGVYVNKKEEEWNLEKIFENLAAD